MYLTISAILDTIPYFMGNVDHGGACITQAFIMTWFDWAVLLWICCLTHSLYLNVVKLEKSEKNELKYQMICWVFPFFVSSIPLAAGSYGEAGLWCWIENGSWMRFGLWYGPLVVLVAGLFGANIYIFRSVSEKAKQWQGTYNPEIQAEKDFLKQQVQPLKYYPMVYLGLSIFPLVNRIQNAVNPSTAVFWLYVLHSCSSPLQGFVNALVYASNTDSDFWRQCSVAGVRRAFASRQASIEEYNITSGDNMSHNMVDDDDEDDEMDEYKMKNVPRKKSSDGPRPDLAYSRA